MTSLLAAMVVLGQGSDKIDPFVQQMFEDAEDARRNVFVLASDQLLADRTGLAEFQAANESKKRRDLRRTTILNLKAKAEAAHKALTTGLPEEADVRPVWLVSGFAAKLTKAEVDSLAAKPGVKYIYGAGGLPTVPQYPEYEGVRPAPQPPFSTDEKRIPWNLEMIGARKVWDELKVTGSGAIIAVFDGGVDIYRPQLEKNLWFNPREVPGNGKDDDSNGLIDDVNGFNFSRMTGDIRPVGNTTQAQHGTLCTGIAVGDGSGGILTGVAPRARFMPIIAGGGAYNAARSMEYALENGADVMSMSFSIPNLGQARGLWRRLSEHATAAGLVLVSGAGNFQQSEQIPVQQRIPEGIPCVISAGGVDQEMEVPPFCSLGPVEWSDVKFYEDYPMPKGLIKPDVCGFPGAGYPVLDPASTGFLDPNEQIRGNSFSSPHIAGVAALMLSANPDLHSWKVKEIMEATAKDVGEPGKDNRTGAGLADAFAAVQAAKKASGPR